MMKHLIRGIAVAGLFVFGVGQTKAGYVTIDPFGSTWTQVTGISGNNIFGIYSPNDSPYFISGFLYNISTSTYTTINYPVPGNNYNQTATYITGLSGNIAVGWYSGLDDGGYHGVLYDTSTSTFTPIDPLPPAISGGSKAIGVSGNYLVGLSYGYSINDFLYNISTSTYTVLNTPTDSSINGISGNYIVGNNGSGFVYDILTSSNMYLHPPESISAQADGVSDNIVYGAYEDSSDTGHGFLYNISTSTYATFDLPPATSWIQTTSVSGSNVVGYYWDNNNGYVGFLYNGSTYTTLDVPSSIWTYATGVSGNNVVGYTYNGGGAGDQQFYGFLYTPNVSAVPEPASLTLFGIGIAGIGCSLWRRRQRSLGKAKS